jgi:hypothetical protein
MSRINNYKELMAEKKKLETDLLTQKAYINNRINTIKEKFEPIGKIVSFFGSVKDNPVSSLLKIGSNLGIEVLVSQKLAKAGWLTKLMLARVLKFISSKVVSRGDQKIIS